MTDAQRAAPPPALDHQHPTEAADAEDLSAIPYKECMRRAEAAIARIAACDDIDEHVRLVREAEGCIREAQRRIRAAEGDVERILGAQAPEADRA